MLNLSRISTLHLSLNRFQDMPVIDSTHFQNVICLIMESNCITKIPQAVFSAAPKLNKINLKDNQITAFPLDFGTWVNFIEINLASNQITVIPEDIRNLVNLEVLQLNNNYIKVIPQGICFLRKLTMLDLEGNKLDALAGEICYLRELVKLNVQSNLLRALPRGIGNLTNLKVLSIGENDIADIPQEIGSLSKLEELYMNDNGDLQALPFELALCQNLQLMSVEGCPLSRMPAQAVEGGPSTIMQYLRFHGPYRHMNFK